MDEGEGKLHIVMWPWLAFGHMIPYMELARCLAQIGHRVSFLSTPRNIDRLPTIPHSLRSRLNLVKLIPPPIQGLPEDCQSTNDVPFDKIPLLQRLQDGLEGQVCAFIEENNPFPDWIIYDMGVYRAPSVANKYGIPSLFFGPFSAMTLSFIGPPSVHLSAGSDRITFSLQQLTQTPPWIPFPTTVGFRSHEAAQILKGMANSSSSSGVPDGYRLGMTFQGCHAAAVRSCTQLEPEWIPLLEKLYQKPVFPVGTLPPGISINEDEDEAWVDLQEWLESVHKKQGCRVVFVGFGSELRLSREKVQEIAFGLELSELPFFWAYRGEPDLFPPGFQERTEDRGRVALGWAPQPRILAHPSVGGFLTHGGWGSCLEGLAFGKPLIMLPMTGDHGLLTCAMVLKKVGAEVLRRNEEDGSFTRDAVAKCLKLVMTDTDEGESIRSNARAMSKIFGDKEQNSRYIEDLANYLVQHRRKEQLSSD